MRHTVQVAMKSYYAVNITCYETQGPKELEIKPLPPPKAVEKRKPPKDPRLTQKEYRSKPENKAKLKAWREKNKDRIQATKYLWLLKNGFVKNPRTDTLDKYGISYNQNLKTYIKKT